jgi:hypothetical protein
MFSTEPHEVHNATTLNRKSGATQWRDLRSQTLINPGETSKKISETAFAKFDKEMASARKFLELLPDESPLSR